MEVRLFRERHPLPIPFGASFCMHYVGGVEIRRKWRKLVSHEIQQETKVMEEEERPRVSVHPELARAIDPPTAMLKPFRKSRRVMSRSIPS